MYISISICHSYSHLVDLEHSSMFHLSPTPFVPSKSLLSSSPSWITIHRNQLRRASSLENITVGGLANWRRKPKPSTSHSQHSVKSAGSKESSREAKNGSKRGLGMGMQATPARKRRLTNKSVSAAMPSYTERLMICRVSGPCRHRKRCDRGFVRGKGT